MGVSYDKHIYYCPKENKPVKKLQHIKKSSNSNSIMYTYVYKYNICGYEP